MAKQLRRFFCWKVNDKLDPTCEEAILIARSTRLAQKHLNSTRKGKWFAHFNFSEKIEKENK